MRITDLAWILIWNGVIGGIVAVNKQQLPVGAIFQDPDTPAHVGFKYAVTLHNADQEAQFRIASHVKPVADTSDAYTFLAGICAMMKTGIFTLIGQNSNVLNNFALSNSEYYNMPYLTLGPHRELKTEVGEYLLRMRPSYTSGIVDLIDWLKWRRFFYLYNSDLGLHRFGQIVSELRRRGLTIFPELIHVPYLQNVTQLRTLINVYGERVRIDVILDFPTLDEMQSVIQTMNDLQLGGPSYHVITTGLDTTMLKVHDKVNLGTTYTGFQLVDDDSPVVKKFYYWWSTLDAQKWPGAGRDKIHSEAALAVDAVKVFTKAVGDLLDVEPDVFRSNFRRGEMYNYADKGMTCSVPGQVWEKGPLLLSSYKQARFEGLTGKVAFDQRGFRYDYEMKIVMRTRTRNWWTIGLWSDKEKLKILDKDLKIVQREFKKFPTEAMKSDPGQNQFSSDDSRNAPAKRLDYSAHCPTGASSKLTPSTAILTPSLLILTLVSIRTLCGINVT